MCGSAALSGVAARWISLDESGVAARWISLDESGDADEPASLAVTAACCWELGEEGGGWV